MPAGSICGRMLDKLCVAYICQLFLNSGNCVKPGHVLSVGVPMMRKMRTIWSSFVVPGNRGLPVYISAMMHPALQISILVLY